VVQVKILIMKGKLYKTEQGWVVRYRETTPLSITTETLPVHPDYVKYYFLDEDAEGGEVEFEIVRHCKKHNSDPSKNSVCTLDCGYEEVSYSKLIKPELYVMDNPCKDISITSLQPHSIVFTIKNGEPVIVLDEVGFKYKGELIEDAGEVYKLFKEFLIQHKKD
jgi:hypothetical protein